MPKGNLSVEETREALKKPSGFFLVFKTTHLTMKAEAVLNNHDIPNRLFPKPKNIISECGVVVKVLEVDLEKAKAICCNKGLGIKEVIKV